MAERQARGVLRLRQVPLGRSPGPEVYPWGYPHMLTTVEKHEQKQGYISPLVCSSVVYDLSVRRSTMSDTYRRYRAIKQGLMQFYQPHPSGHQECHLNSLVGLICGLPGSQRAHLSSIADHAPSHSADQESVITLCWLPFLLLPFSRRIGSRQHTGRIVAESMRSKSRVLQHIVSSSSRESP